MSAIFGAVRFDAAPVDRDLLAPMAEKLRRRGPDRTALWVGETAALGHGLLATTPEALTERQPWVHAATGCVITGDVRLDNRAELISRLGLPASAANTTGDGELVLKSYLAWGAECGAELLGDFAFAIWDPRHQRLVCARDKMGMRQLIYHHLPGRCFAFATEASALLQLGHVPARLNEGRMADFLVGTLEAVDLTSTFFEGISRLAPAHVLVVDSRGLRKTRYWRIEAGPELKLASDEEYAEAFLQVFRPAVAARLRSPAPVGAMLSGGMDSGTIVAVASRHLAATANGPLRTFSAVGPDPDACVETRAIHAALTMRDLSPTLVDYTDLGDLLPELATALENVEEPFDYDMNLIRAVDLTAHHAGIKVMLDGAAGDLVLSHGDAIARFIRSGAWRRAWAEARGERQFWGHSFPAGRTLLSGAFAAFAPDRLYDTVKSARRAKVRQAWFAQSPVDPDFARRIDLPARYEMSQRAAVSSRWDTLAERRRAALEHPALIVGRERYDRVAGALAIEPRDPFLDTRVLEFCLRLPAGQLIRDGWPKYLLRHATKGMLPDAVRWRRGKEHLGPAFTSAVMSAARCAPQSYPAALRPLLKSSIRVNGLHGSPPPGLLADERQAQLSALAAWMARHPGAP